MNLGKRTGVLALAAVAAIAVRRHVGRHRIASALAEVTPDGAGEDKPSPLPETLPQHTGRQ